MWPPGASTGGLRREPGACRRVSVRPGVPAAREVPETDPAVAPRGDQGAPVGGEGHGDGAAAGRGRRCHGHDGPVVPVVVFHRRTSPERLSVATTRPPGPVAAVGGVSGGRSARGGVPVARVLRGSPEAAFQTRTTAIASPDARVWPSELKARARTGPMRPRSVSRVRPVSVSSRRTDLSWLPTASRAPSGLNARTVTAAEGPVKVRSARWVAVVFQEDGAVRAADGEGVAVGAEGQGIDERSAALDGAAGVAGGGVPQPHFGAGLADGEGTAVPGEGQSGAVAVPGRCRPAG